jgi:hypothetical protein
LDGFGGHPPLLGCIGSRPYRVGLRKDDAIARLLLDRGADPHVRASQRKRLRFVADESMHECRVMTPLRWGGAADRALRLRPTDDSASAGAPQPSTASVRQLP